MVVNYYTFRVKHDKPYQGIFFLSLTNFDLYLFSVIIFIPSFMCVFLTLRFSEKNDCGNPEFDR